MSSTNGMLSVPFGPFTESRPSATVAVTPDGTAIGFFPIRDMGAGSLEYFCQHLAADVLRTRFRVRQNALWRRDDGDAQDRKSVVEGKSGSVRVDLGGRRFI